jgi:MoaA/NifB/PqqE/SkfB family radical SAM enzyme
MVRAAAEKGFQVCIHTNATRLTGELGRELIEAGLSEISFSFDGETREEYERIRVGAEFDKTLSNILRFLETKKALGRRNPRATLQIIKPFDGAHSAPPGPSPEFMARFDGLPLDDVRILTPHTWAGEKTEVGCRPLGTRYFPCQTAWESMSIAWDGRVLLCCGDLNGRVVLGDVTRQTAEEIWRGPIRDLRRALAEHREGSLPLCRQCDALWRQTHPLISDLGNAAPLRPLIAPLRRMKGILSAAKTGGR